VDDWSFRARQAGTLLVDLERHQPVDVLLGSDEEVFADWLGEHPGVEIISRDRGASYLKGANKGAPQAKQVLDRWHLCKNLEEVLQKALARQIDVLRQADQKVKEGSQNQPTAPARLVQARGRQRKPPRRKAPSPSPQRAWQLSVYQQVHELAARGENHTERLLPVCKSSVKRSANTCACLSLSIGATAPFRLISNRIEPIFKSVGSKGRS
jgi:transposase